MGISMSSHTLSDWSGTAASNDLTDYASTGMASSLYKNAIWNLQADLKSHEYTLNTDTGSANAYAIAPTRAIGSYFAGYKTWFLPAHANTGASTLNVNSLGTKNIYAHGAALLGGELSTTVPALVEYDGTQFNLINPEVSSGSFTATLTGMSSTTTGTMKYRIQNGLVTVWTDSSITGTSNATTMTMTGVPAAIQPATTRTVLCSVADNGVFYASSATITAASGTWTFYKSFAGSSFTSSGIKGLNMAAFSYYL
jgi:hypothetical protein